jgi:hypothetical protein
VRRRVPSSFVALAAALTTGCMTTSAVDPPAAPPIARATRWSTCTIDARLVSDSGTEVGAEAWAPALSAIRQSADATGLLGVPGASQVHLQLEVRSGGWKPAWIALFCLTAFLAPLWNEYELVLTATLHPATGPAITAERRSAVREYFSLGLLFVPTLWGVVSVATELDNLDVEPVPEHLRALTTCVLHDLAAREDRTRAESGPRPELEPPVALTAPPPVSPVTAPAPPTLALAPLAWREGAGPASAGRATPCSSWPTSTQPGPTGT